MLINMKKSVYVLLFLFLSLPVTAQSGFQSNEDFFSFICNYYTNPQPQRLAQSFEYYVNSPYIQANSIMMAQFYTVLLEGDSALLKTIFDEYVSGKSVTAKIFMLQILAEMNTPESSAYLARAQKEWEQDSVQVALVRIKNSEPADVFTEAPKNTADLDRLWGIFWANGNEKAISQIVSVLYLWEEGRGAPAATGGAVKWALTRNAAQHPKILEIIKTEMDSGTETQKKLLQEIITEVEEK